MTSEWQLERVPSSDEPRFSVMPPAGSTGYSQFRHAARG